MKNRQVLEYTEGWRVRVYYSLSSTSEDFFFESYERARDFVRLCTQERGKAIEEKNAIGDTVCMNTSAISRAILSGEKFCRIWLEGYLPCLVEKGKLDYEPHRSAMNNWAKENLSKEEYEKFWKTE